MLGASALVAIAIPLYMRGEHVAASLLAAIGELVLLVAAVRWWRRDGTMAQALPPVAALTRAGS